MKESDDKNNKKPELRRVPTGHPDGHERDEKEMFRRQRYQQPVPYPRREYLTSPFYPKTMPMVRKGAYDERPTEVVRMIPGMGPERAVNTAEVKCAIDFIQKVKNCYSDESEIFLKFLDVMKEFKQGRKSIDDVANRIRAIFCDNEVLLMEFQKFLPLAAGYLKMEVVPQPEKVVEGDAVEFISEAKKQFSKEPEMYASLIKILSYLKTKPIPESKFNELKELLCGYPDLIEKLHRFVPESDIKKETDDSPFSAINNKLKHINAHEPFMKCMNAFNQNLITKKDLIFLLRPLLEDENLINEMKRYLNYEEIEFGEPNPKKLKVLRREGSYRILPADCKIKYENDTTVLNRICIGCPTHDREDETYVFLKRNAHEEVLFRIEDERFESDLILSRVESIILALEKIVIVCKKNKDDEFEISLEDLEVSGTIIQELLEYIYGSSANDVMDGLLGNPKEVAPILLARLYNVDCVLREERAKKNKMWDEAVKNNHYKALEASFFDFKINDKKSLAYKSISKSMVGVKKKIFSDSVEIVIDLIKCFEEGFELTKETRVAEIVSPMLAVLQTNAQFYCSLPIFCIFTYLMILLERISEIKHWPKVEIRENKLATKLGFQQYGKVTDSQARIYELLRLFMAGNITADKFEEEIRIVSGGKGYKLFNTDKLMNKIASKVAILREDQLNMELLEDVFNSRSQLEKVNSLSADESYKFTIQDSFVEIEKILNESKPKNLEIIEDFKSLKYDETLFTRPVYLARSLMPLNKSFSYFNVEHYLCEDSKGLKCVPGTEDFFARYSVGRYKNEK